MDDVCALVIPSLLCIDPLSDTGELHGDESDEIVIVRHVRRI